MKFLSILFLICIFSCSLLKKTEKRKEMSGGVLSAAQRKIDLKDKSKYIIPIYNDTDNYSQFLDSLYKIIKKNSSKFSKKYIKIYKKNHIEEPNDINFNIYINRVGKIDSLIFNKNILNAKKGTLGYLLLSSKNQIIQLDKWSFDSNGMQSYHGEILKVSFFQAKGELLIQIESSKGGLYFSKLYKDLYYPKDINLETY